MLFYNRCVEEKIHLSKVLVYFYFFNPKELGYNTEMDVVHASLSHKCECYCTRKSQCLVLVLTWFTDPDRGDIHLVSIVFFIVFCLASLNFISSFSRKLTAISTATKNIQTYVI